MDPNPYESPHDENPLPSAPTQSLAYDWKRLCIFGVRLAIVCSLTRFILITVLGLRFTTDPLLILIAVVAYLGFPLGIVGAVTGGIGWLFSRLKQPKPTRPSSL